MGKTVTGLLLIAVGVALIVTGGGAQVGVGLILAGVATLAVKIPKFEQPETVGTPIKSQLPPRVSCYGERRLFGAYVLFENTSFSVNSSTFAPYALDAFAVHDGPIDSITARYLGDDLITLNGSGYVVKLGNGAYGDVLVRWYETTGQTPGTAAWAEFNTLLPGIWGADHRGDGVVMIGVVWKPVSSDEFSERFPQGAAAASMVARWQKVFDWRDGTQVVSNPASWKWSANAVLHTAHYRLTREKARRLPGAAMPSAAALLDAWNIFFAPTVAYWTTAANIADEAVPLKGGGTEPRYRSCFAHKHTDPHKEVIDALTACFDGWISPRADGALVVYAGKFYTPTVSIGPTEIVSYSWQYGVVDEESVNEIKINYVSPLHKYELVDADAWVDPDDMLARGAVRTQTLEFQVPSHGQARRLTKRAFAHIMSPNRGVVTTNVAGRIVRGQRYVNLRIEEADAVFFDGVAEITQLVRNTDTGGVTFNWVEITSNIDAWAELTEEGDPAPVGDSATLLSPDAPVISSASLIYDPSASGTTGVRVMITLAGPHGDDLKWFARWRREGDAVWNEQEYSDVDSSGSVELITGFVPADRDLEVEVAYMPGTGALSAWSFPATNVSTDTNTVAPDAATEINFIEWTDRLVLSTTYIPRATAYRWRFYAADGVTLVRTINTTAREVTYSTAQAHIDGVLRSYKVSVAGTNAAGTGVALMSGLLSNAAPAAVTGVVFADGTTTSTATFTASGATDLRAYLVAYSTAASFDPQTQGASFLAGASPAYTPQLPAGTYYGKIAAVDLWSAQPALLNFSAEDSFVISTGVGTASGGGGGGGVSGGGGSDGFAVVHV